MLLVNLLLSLVFNTGMPLSIKYLIDDGIMKQDMNALLLYSLLALCIVGISETIGVFMGLGQTKLQNMVVLKTNLETLENYYKTPYERILKNEKGYFVSRIYDDTVKAIAPLLNLLMTMIVSTFTIIAVISVLVYLSWRLSILLSLSVPIFYFITTRLSQKIKSTSKQSSEDEAKAKGILERLVGAYQIVNVFSLHTVALGKYKRHLQQNLDTSYSNVKHSTVYTHLSSNLAFSTQIFLLLASGYEIIQGRLTFGGALALSNLFGILTGKASTIFSSISTLQKTLASLDRLFEFWALAGEQSAMPVSKQIVLSDVSFAYDEQMIFERLDLTINKGERVLVLGPNGSGKTTLIHLISGFLAPTKGKAQVPDMSRISFVPSPPCFIPGNVKECVNYDHLEKDRQKLFYELAGIFGVDDKILEDPEDLSAGQRQKVSTIMSLLKGADTYIFDEPLANIDVETRECVLNKILELTDGKTLIVVMHGGEAYYKHFDKVIHLDSRGIKLRRNIRLSHAVSASQL